MVKRKPRLTFIDKIILKKQGKEDAGRKQFQIYETGEIFSGYSEWRGKPKLVVSARIVRELSQYNAQRDHLLERGLCIARIPGAAGIIWIKIKRFSKVQSQLTEEIIDREITIRQLYRSYQETEADLADRYRRSLENKSLQYQQLYRNKLNTAFEIYRRNANQTYESMIGLMDEKIRLMEVMGDRLTAVRAGRYLRIYYYYESARKVNPSLPLSPLNDKNLNLIGNTAVLGQYERQLEKAYVKRDELLKLCPPQKRIRLAGETVTAINSDDDGDAEYEKVEDHRQVSSRIKG